MKELELKNIPQLPFDVEEAINQLRINIGFCGDEIKTIMITSSTPNEGKSFIAIHLWKMMAEVGLHTLLIDCDLRNSEMRTKYGISLKEDEKITGIAHYLSGKTHLEDSIYHTNINNGDMIPLATTIGNPSILLESNRFAKMIEKCREQYDYIILDTPPMGNVADAMRIATHSDGTILVVRSGGTPKKLIENSIQMLKRTEIPLLGIVLNRADMQSKTSSYYRRYYRKYGGYYYKKYQYGYGYGKKKSQSQLNGEET